MQPKPRKSFFQTGDSATFAVNEFGLSDFLTFLLSAHDVDGEFVDDFACLCYNGVRLDSFFASEILALSMALNFVIYLFI